MDQCSGCKFWFADHPDIGEELRRRGLGSVGERSLCRRYPPAHASGVGYPLTAADDWCGEFEPRGDEQRPE